MRSLVLSLFLAVLGACRPAAGGPLPPGAEALVTEREFIVAFPAAAPAAAERTTPSRAGAFPYYDWRFVTPGPVVVVVRDTALVRALRRARPPQVWRSVFRPDGLFLHDSVRISYEQ